MRSSAVIALLLAGGIASGAQSPSEAAVEWLRHVASGEAEAKLVDETAISPDTSEDELKTIRKRISHLRQGLRPEDLKAVADKEDGDLAAVLVSQVTNFDADSVQIHAVGLVKSEGRWLPAPLPSSFNNTGLSLRPGFLKRVKGLEDWMLRTRSTQLVRLKDDAFSVLFDEMRKVKDPQELHKATPGNLAKDFLAALQARDLPAVLAMLGGLESPRPADFDDAFPVLSRILQQQHISHPRWRLLAAPEAARAIVMVEENQSDALVSIVAMDPAGNFALRPRAKPVHLPFVKSKAGAWRIDLPHELLSPQSPKKSPGREEEDEGFDADLIALLPEKLAETIKAQPEPTAQAAAGAVVTALQSPSFQEVCRRMDPDAKKTPALDAMGRAALLWQRVHQRQGTASPILLEVHEEGDDACALVQMFSGQDPGKASIETLFLHRGSKGWLANRAFSGAPALAHVSEGGAMGKWIGTAVKNREKDWSAGVIARIGGIAADSAPAEEEARRVVADWRAAIAAGDGARMLSLSACFDDDAGSARLLRNTSYELAARQKGEILGVHRAGRWAAVSLRVPPPAADDSADAYPLIVVAATPAGPKVLPEIDLYDPLTRSREFLNRSVWDRVTARLPEGARGELESIYEKHRTISAATRERRPKSTE